MEEMLRADNITFSYTDDQHRAVDGLSLRVKRGEYVAVLGANGCGKSTLAKHFNAILLPQAGTVYVEDMSTADEDKLFDIRQKVGMVFQNPDNQIVATVVEEDVAFALENLGVPLRKCGRVWTRPCRWPGSINTGKRARTSCPAGRSSAWPSRA